MLRPRQLIFTLLFLMGLLPTALQAALPTFEVEFSADVHQQPYSGRVYLFFSRQLEEPRRGPNWFHPEPLLAMEVTDWQPGETLELSFDDPAALIFPPEDFPKSLEGCRVQAVARFNDWVRAVGTGPGNGYSDVKEIGPDEKRVRLVIDSLVKERPYQETKWGKLFTVRSETLSSLHDHETSFRATVLLPASYYDEPRRRYPVIFFIPGFGGNHRNAGPFRQVDPVKEPVHYENADGVEFIRVLLDPNCRTGHHVFADSANNGPVGTAFVEEFLPALDAAFRTIPEASARFLTGHSSGGWSSLWVQITHPEIFGGVWSTSPDPVDFRDFQKINLYEPGVNMWSDEAGEPRPLARAHGRVLIEYKTFDLMEQVMGHGGQLQSFEAVFSPRGDDGQPMPLWSRETGAVNHEVAKAWRQYDINLVLQKRWEKIGPKLEGKIHVFMGAEDTFYLDGATRKLKTTLEELGSDAVVELVPGANHFTLVTEELRERIREEMTAAFLREHSEWPEE